jgi:hypothetical protein
VARVGLLDQLRQESRLLVENQRGDEGAAAESVFPLRRDDLELGVGVHGVALRKKEMVLVAVICLEDEISSEATKHIIAQGSIASSQYDDPQRVPLPPYQKKNEKAPTTKQKKKIKKELTIVLPTKSQAKYCAFLSFAGVI